MAEAKEAGAAAEKSTKTRPARGDAHCSVANCKRPYRAKGYCVTHYKRWRRGEIEGHHARYKICSKEGCRKPATLHGMCEEHAGGTKTAAAS
jgi:hypothetical protein